jgi:hypothetical protein
VVSEPTAAAMGQWLLAAQRVFLTVPDHFRKHAILLTDGANEHETPTS